MSASSTVVLIRTRGMLLICHEYGLPACASRPMGEIGTGQRPNNKGDGLTPPYSEACAQEFGQTH